MEQTNNSKYNQLTIHVLLMEKRHISWAYKFKSSIMYSNLNFMNAPKQKKKRSMSFLKHSIESKLHLYHRSLINLPSRWLEAGWSPFPQSNGSPRGQAPPVRLWVACPCPVPCGRSCPHWDLLQPGTQLNTGLWGMESQWWRGGRGVLSPPLWGQGWALRDWVSLWSKPVLLHVIFYRHQFNKM